MVYFLKEYAYAVLPGHRPNFCSQIGQDIHNEKKLVGYIKNPETMAAKIMTVVKAAVHSIWSETILSSIKGDPHYIIYGDKQNIREGLEAVTDAIDTAINSQLVDFVQTHIHGVHELFATKLTKSTEPDVSAQFATAIESKIDLFSAGCESRESSILEEIAKHQMSLEKILSEKVIFKLLHRTPDVKCDMKYVDAILAEFSQQFDNVYKVMKIKDHKFIDNKNEMGLFVAEARNTFVDALEKESSGWMDGHANTDDTDISEPQIKQFEAFLLALNSFGAHAFAKFRMVSIKLNFSKKTPVEIIVFQFKNIFQTIKL